MTPPFSQVRFLEARVPVRASLDADGAGVALSPSCAFFDARARFTLHLLIASLDPSAPLAWQLDVDPATAALAAAGAAAVDAATAEATVRSRVGAVVGAHSRGFGRLRAIHSGLLEAFRPAP